MRRILLSSVLTATLGLAGCADAFQDGAPSGGPGAGGDTEATDGGDGFADSADGTGGADGTDATDGTDGTDATDGSDATDGTDGTDATDGTGPTLSDDPVPDFALVDQNPNSPTAGQPVSPRDLIAQTSGWYFTHAT